MHSDYHFLLIALKRIAVAMRSSTGLQPVFQTVVSELGRTLEASSCALHVETSLAADIMTASYVRDTTARNRERAILPADLDLCAAHFASSTDPYLIERDASAPQSMSPGIGVPLQFEGRMIGMLLIRSGEGSHAWGETELLWLGTVADQLTITINQAHLFAQMEQQALTDGLTGSYNRRAFEMQLERDLNATMRMRQPLSLVMLDIDNFKRINHESGHEAGDQALCRVADCLRRELRAMDTPARLGGDEFAVILPQADERGVKKVAERLRRRIASLDPGATGRLTASFGVATYPHNGAHREALVAAADQALLQAKESGRNCVIAAGGNSPGTVDRSLGVDEYDIWAEPEAEPSPAG